MIVTTCCFVKDMLIIFFAIYRELKVDVIKLHLQVCHMTGGEIPLDRQ